MTKNPSSFARSRTLFLFLRLPVLALLSLCVQDEPICGEPFPVERFDANGFAVPEDGTVLRFPRDHGSHPQFRIEWWYITGHLKSQDKQAWGFQITFFRYATEAMQNSDPRQIYMAHAAIFDKTKGAFHHEERLNREGWNARAAVGPLDVFNGNWYLRMTDPETEKMETRFSVKGNHRTKLKLTPLKRRTLFGENGVSQKGDDPNARSHYVSFTRLHASGALEIGMERFDVEGVAWMDHEFSSSQLGPQQIGWNWSSLILDDGSEIMAYVMRREDGEIDPHSSLTIITRDSSTRVLGPDKFQWFPIRYWTSEQTGARYPVEYEIKWKSEAGPDRIIRVRPSGDSQELSGRIGGFAYWEGVGEAQDDKGRIIGKVYTELTGYARSMANRF